MIPSTESNFRYRATAPALTYRMTSRGPNMNLSDVLRAACLKPVARACSVPDRLGATALFTRATCGGGSYA